MKCQHLQEGKVLECTAGGQLMAPSIQELRLCCYGDPHRCQYYVECLAATNWQSIDISPVEFFRIQSEKSRHDLCVRK
ncbi:MAG TPA: hypothetical protein VFG11_02055 [Acidobacteriota bacterium]|nr:hypothetical protein [Acidobacteriota bacterium]